MSSVIVLDKKSLINESEKISQVFDIGNMVMVLTDKGVIYKLGQKEVQKPVEAKPPVTGAKRGPKPKAKGPTLSNVQVSKEGVVTANVEDEDVPSVLVGTAVEMANGPTSGMTIE